MFNGPGWKKMCTRYVYLTSLPFIAGFPRGYIYQESESNATNKIVIWPILRLGDYYQAVIATDNYLLSEMLKKWQL